MFRIRSRNGLIPPPPKGVDNSGLQVEFISILAQAQKAVATAGIERMWQFGAQIGAIKPEALDRLDTDGTMDAYADMTGAPASVLVDRKKAEQARQARTQAQAQQAALAGVQQLANTARTASQIDVGGGQNAVTAMLGRTGRNGGRNSFRSSISRERTAERFQRPPYGSKNRMAS